MSYKLTLDGGLMREFDLAPAIATLKTWQSEERSRSSKPIVPNFRRPRLSLDGQERALCLRSGPPGWQKASNEEKILRLR